MCFTTVSISGKGFIFVEGTSRSCLVNFWMPGLLALFLPPVSARLVKFPRLESHNSAISKCLLSLYMEEQQNDMWKGSFRKVILGAVCIIGGGVTKPAEKGGCIGISRSWKWTIVHRSGSHMVLRVYGRPALQVQPSSQIRCPNLYFHQQGPRVLDAPYFYGTWWLLLQQIMLKLSKCMQYPSFCSPS
jgi:hypothetical protein